MPCNYCGKGHITRYCERKPPKIHSKGNKMADANTLKLFADLGDLLVQAVKAKADYDASGVWGVMGDAIALMTQAQKVLADIKAAVPEFDSMSPSDDAAVLAACLACFQKVLAAV